MVVDLITLAGVLVVMIMVIWNAPRELTTIVMTTPTHQGGPMNQERANMAEGVEREAARLIWETSRADEGTISTMGADIIAHALAVEGLLRQDPPQVAGEDVERVAREEAERRWPNGHMHSAAGAFEMGQRSGYVEGRLAALSARPTFEDHYLRGGMTPAEWWSLYDQELRRADRLQRIIDGYDRTPHEQRAADAEAERVAALARAEAAEAVIEQVRALADEWASHFDHEVDEVARLRALLDGDGDGAAGSGEQTPTMDPAHYDGPLTHSNGDKEKS